MRIWLQPEKWMRWHWCEHADIFYQLQGTRLIFSLTQGYFGCHPCSQGLPHVTDRCHVCGTRPLGATDRFAFKRPLDYGLTGWTTTGIACGFCLDGLSPPHPQAGFSGRLSNEQDAHKITAPAGWVHPGDRLGPMRWGGVGEWLAFAPEWRRPAGRRR